MMGSLLGSEYLSVLNIQIVSGHLSSHPTQETCPEAIRPHFGHTSLPVEGT